ncbi:hypothetical protein MTO96_049811 [Rhipicephalus appendiculatus]
MSGHGCSTTGNMLSNPFCFVLQVFLGIHLAPDYLQRTCAQHGPGPALQLTADVKNSTCDAAELRFIVPAWLSTAVTSHHVSYSRAIRAAPVPSFASGHGCSTTGNMLSNPVCFVLQVFLGIHLAPDYLQKTCAQHGPGPALQLTADVKNSTCDAAELRFIVPAWLSTAVTSHHVSYSRAIRAAPVPSFASGHGCSTTGNMLSNPVCFVLQVFLGIHLAPDYLQRTCAQHGPGPALQLTAGVKNSTCDAAELRFIVPAWLSTAVTSHHVSYSRAIRAAPVPSFASGHGCSTTGNMLSNPVCFVLQVFLGIHLAPDYLQRTCAQHGPGPALQLTADVKNSTCDAAELRFIVPAWLSTAVTSHHVSYSRAIRAAPVPSFASGHGCSTTGNMLSNPFCFVLQVTPNLSMLAFYKAASWFRRGAVFGLQSNLAF